MSVNERSEVPAESDIPEWWVYQGTGQPLRADIRLDDLLPPPPPWRSFNGGPVPDNDVPPDDDGEADRRLGSRRALPGALADPHELDMVNAAIYLRRPLLVTGPPGAGKSSLAFQIAEELRLGRVVRWHITSNSTLKSGLYNYDAIGRAEAVATRQSAARWSAQKESAEEGPSSSPGEQLGDYVRLGPLATAFLPSRLPRVLLIDELDKSEIDLPNDLLKIFEDGSFQIPELERVANHMPTLSVFTDDPDRRADITGGRVRCLAFPIVVITSNGERDFPPPFLRRCLQLEIKQPDVDKLAAMVAAHLGDDQDDLRLELVQDFVRRSELTGGLPADRLLDALFLSTSGAYSRDAVSWPRLRDALWRHLRTTV